MLNFLQNKLNKTKGAWTIFFVIGLALAFLSGIESGKELEVVYIYADSVVTIVDTLQVEHTVERWLPARIETVSVVHTYVDSFTHTVVETLLLTNVARLDTLLEDGELNLAYYTGPQYFDFSWKPVPLEVRCSQVFGGELRFADPKIVRFSLGIGLGRTWDEENFHYGAVFTGHIWRNMVYLAADHRGYTIGVGREFW